MTELECQLTLTDGDFIMRNHRVHDVSVLPGVTFLDIVYRMLIAAGADHTRAVIRNVVFAEAIATTEGFDREIRCRVAEPVDGVRRITVESRWLRDGAPGSEWRDNFTGELVYRDDPEPAAIDPAALRGRAGTHGDLGELYARARREDIVHGAPMRCVGALHRGGPGEPFLLAELRLEEPGPGHEERFHLHPAKLDASTLAGFGQTEVSGDHPFIPMFIKEFRAPRPLRGTCYVYAPRPEALADSGDVITSDYGLYDVDGRFLAGFAGITCKRIRHPQLIHRLLDGTGSGSAGPAEGGSAAVTSGGGTGTQRPFAGVDRPDDAPAATGDLVAYLRRVVAGMLDRPVEQVRPDVGFYDLGLDSLAILRLGRDLEDLVGETLYPTLLFEYSDIDRLAGHLATTYQIRGDAIRPAEPPARAGATDSAGGPDHPAGGEPAARRTGPEPSADAPDPAVGWTELRTDRWVAGTGPVRDPGGLTVVGSGALADALRPLAGGAAGGGDLALVLPGDADPVRACRSVWTEATRLLDTGRPARLTVLQLAETDVETDAGTVVTSPAMAAVAALGRTITAETPALRCRAVTVDAPKAVTEAVRDDSTEAELRYVGGRRLVRRWVPVTVPADAPVPVRSGGAYLISGGAGGLGLMLADHLVRTRKARVMLVGRRSADAALDARLRAWRDLGGDVRYQVADVADAAGAARAAEAIRSAFGRIDGVVHCAGVRRDGVSFRLDAADFDATMAPKWAGTVHLDAATAPDDLDFFVVYSSLSASLANPGQSAYAAANAAAEAVVRRRAARDDRAGRSVAIGWPFWADGGMAVSDETVRRSVADGRLPLPTEAGLAALDRALAATEPLLVALHGRPGAVEEMLPAAPATHATAAGSDGSVPLPATPAVARDRDTATADGIAVIGVAGRYPRAADLDEFWRNLAEGLDCVTEVPADRWDHGEIYDPARNAKGRTYGRWGGFLDGVDGFDAPFFGISRREAERMDPQERLFLTTCWHAVEDAGYSPTAVAGARVGVFAGVMWNHYQLVSGADDGVAPTAMHASIANRVSYTLDLTGPSIAVDTACSSSLTAVHLAVESLRRGECDMALAGGVNATVHPQKYLQLAQGQWLSSDGRCRAFGRDGSGYVPGEGVGAVLLKPLALARRDGDPIHGVIRAAVVNHGGRTGGVTVPSPVSQAALIEAALGAAGWAPETVGYLEAHGTGTSLGDPIEVDGARRALGGPRPDGSTCAIGSVKSNVGHLEGAAGIAGVTKVLLQMRHRAIVPSLHSGDLNPNIDFAATPFVVPQKTVPWPRLGDAPRRAGVSAFGAGGANAHVLIEEAEPRRQAPTGPGPWLFPLSARDEETLQAYATRLARWLRDRDGDGEPAGAADVSALADRIATLLGVPAGGIEPDTRLGDLGLDPAELAELADGTPPDGLDERHTIAELARLVRAGSGGSRPADIAYTLQVGRTPMDHRLAIVADDLTALADALDRYAGGAAPQAGEFWGEDAAGPSTGEDYAARFRAGDLGAVARAWVAGAEVPWADCHPAGARPNRISLPGYPFRERPYWLGRWRSAARSVPDAGAAPAAPVAPAAAQPSVTARTAEPEPAGTVADGAEADLRVLDGGVALVTMRSTMFTDGLLRELRAAFDAIAADDGIRAVVLTGEGAVFSMGGTPEALATLAAGEGRFSDVPFLYEGLLRCERPVIAAIQGHAAGGGFAFGLFADIVVLSAAGEYRANFLNYGFTPGVGATYILERRLGSALAAELMLTGRALRGEELARRGADVSVVSGTQVLPTALSLARSVADKAPEAARELKAELARRVLDRLPEVIDREVAMHERVLGEDAARRVERFFGSTGERTEAEATEPVAAAEPVPAAEPVAPPGPTAAAEPVAPVAAAEPVTPAEPARSAPDPDLDPAEVRDGVEDIVGAALYLERDEIDPAVSFAEMGLDSVGAVEVVGQLNRRFDIDLDSVAVYEHPTVPALTEAVLAERGRAAVLRAAATATHAQPAPPAPESEPEVPEQTRVPADADVRLEPADEPRAPAEPVELPAAGGAVPPAGGPEAPDAPAPGRVRLAPLSAPAGGPAPAVNGAAVRLASPDDAAGTDAEPPAATAEPAATQPVASEPPAAPAAPVTDQPAVSASVEGSGSAARADDIAVIGMSGRFPDAPDLDAFWANLAAGRSSIREVPPERWDIGRYYDPDRLAPGRTYSKWAALLPEVDRFDERFFNLSPLDAEAMDPQQRLFLVEAWRALENAGYAGSDAARRWGVFVGCGAGDYADLLAAADRLGTSQAFLGNTPSVLAARIAYLLDLTGPTLAVDTACSSSLVAVDLACGAIARGECEAALAGGVAVMSTPKMHVWTSKTGMLSPTGRCAPFDDDADGIVLGEGVGVVVLKSLSRALADGDHIHGVIRATGANGDGRTNGITAPSATSQANLLTSVYARAGVEPDEIGYVEAHGTGTALGDPIEVKALTEVFAPAGAGTRSCGLGSVKGNIGHTTMAAGIAGLLKVLLALRHRQLPPSAGFRTPNSRLDLDAGPFFVVDELTPWRPGPSGRRIGVVSSFGFSGTNCHVVVAEAPPVAEPPVEVAEPAVVPLSARTPDELRARVADLVAYLETREPALRDVAYTLAVGRPHLPHRVAIVAADLAGLRAALQDRPVSGTGDEPPPDPAGLVEAVRAAGTEAARRAALDRLAAGYAAGAEVDWSALYADRPGRRIPLPNYPFARTRHWVEPVPGVEPQDVSPARAAGADPAASGSEPVSGADPLLGAVDGSGVAGGGSAAGTSDAGPVRFTRDLEPTDPLVADHRVAGEPVLPAAAGLRLLVAAALARGADAPLSVTGARWLRPVRPGGTLTITTSGPLDALTVTVTDGAGECLRGRVAAAPADRPGPLDLAALAGRCPRSRPGTELYADFRTGGVDYRGDFQVLENLRWGDDDALGTLRPLPPGPAAHHGPGLHPAVLDGAVQAAVTLVRPDATAPLLPFAVDRFDVYDPVATPRYAHVRRSGDRRFAIHVADAAGAVCAVLDGVSLRPAGTATAARDTAGLVYVPEWVPAPAPSVPTAGRIAVVGDPADPLAQALLRPGAKAAVAVAPDDIDALATDPEQPYDVVYLLAPAGEADPIEPTRVLFRLVKRLLSAGLGRRALTLVVVTRGALAVSGAPARPPQAGVLGLVRGVAAEYPRWRIGCVDLPGSGGETEDPAETAARIRAEDGALPLVALRDGGRLTRRLVPLNDGAGATFEAGTAGNRIKGGTYLILGGTGGLGVVLSRHLARTGARIAWLGRRPLDERIRRETAEIERLGGTAMYAQADAADPAALRRAVAEVTERFGPVTGAVHAALELRDRALGTMTEADLDAVLAAKVTGTVAFADALADQPLDFLAFFSSAMSFADAPGQANYAAASTFQDAYALALRARGVPTFVVNWGFWGSVGAVAGPDYRQRFEALGIAPIEPDEGIAAFTRILAANLPQALVVKGNASGLARLGIDADRIDGGGPASGDTEAGGTAGTGADVGAPDLSRDVAGYAALDEYARELVGRRLAGLPGMPEPGERVDVDSLADRLGVAADRRRLFAAVLDVAHRAGALRIDGDSVRTVRGGVRADGDSAADEGSGADLRRRHPELAPHAGLLEGCVVALPDVLTGRRSGVEVLFPGGAAGTVEEIYRGNPGSDFHHRLVAEEAAEHARRVAAEHGRPARILEIGAGTGASTAFVLPALSGLDPAPEVTYTDISPNFLRHGEREFGSSYPRLDCRTFDVERDPAGQGLPAGGYDVVYATNVLHATADLATTVRNAAALLAPDGLLLVNEVTRRADFLTVTFGLTSGWWRFTDSHRRLPHAPLLAPAQWRAVLAEAGLSVPAVRGIPGTDQDALEQCVLVARRPVRVSAGGETPVGAPAGGATPSGTSPRRAVRDYVRRVFAEVLRFAPDDLDERATFDAFGIDSLVSLNIVDRFEKDLGPLPSTLLFENMTIEALADHFVAEHRDRLDAITGPHDRQSADELPSSDGLSPTDGVAVEARPSADDRRPVDEPQPADDRRPPDEVAAPAEGLAAIAEPRDPRPGGNDIAVIGVTGRYPGSPDLDTFWANLAAGTNLITEVPPERWDWRERFDARPGRPQHTYSRWGGFIDGVDLFDPGFFGILPREAAAMDPQERLFLETAWTLLQDAGYLDEHTRERSTGVFVGTMYGSYGRIAAAQGWPRGRFGDGHSAYWSIANRVSYVLDLQGPSFAVDSACSSSLTAVHLACESLRRGECRMAVAGGVNLILHPAHLITLSSMTMLSADGACKVFDSRADGFVPGEGVGAVLLKPLAAAVADGDQIWAVIKGGHANAGGRTSGYTVPNPGAQAELVTRAIRHAGVEPSTISYVEAHGTGTALGDPIELSALARAMREAGGVDRCAVGSVKANIGHLEGAAGIAGLTKVLLQLRHRTIAPQANLETLNPKIDMTTSPFHVPTEPTDWTSAGPRRAGISSFGAGGANVHLVVEEYPQPSGGAGPAEGEQLVLLSARTPEQLTRYAGQVADRVAADRPDLADLAFTSQVGRAVLAHRLAVRAAGTDELVDRLRAVARGEDPAGTTRGTAGREVADILDGDDGGAFLASLLAGRDLDRLGRLWAHGTAVDWRPLWTGRSPRRVTLPPYPFDRRRFWLPDDPVDAPEPSAGAESATEPSGPAEPAGSGEYPLDGRLAGQHRVGGQLWTTGAALLTLVHEAAAGTTHGPAQLRDLRWVAPLRRDTGTVRVEVAHAADRNTIRVRPEPGAAPVVEAVAVTDPETAPGTIDLVEVRDRCARAVAPDKAYAALRAGGIEHGPALRVLDEVWLGDGEYLARLRSPVTGEPGRPVEPALVDGALQALAVLDGPDVSDSARGYQDVGGRVPVGAAAVTVRGPLPAACWAYGHEVPAPDGHRRFDLRIADDAGRVLLALDGLDTAPARTAGRPAAVAVPGSGGEPPAPGNPQPAGNLRLLRPSWRPAALDGTPAPPRLALVSGEPDAVAAVAARLAGAGTRCLRVTSGAGYRALGEDAYQMGADVAGDAARLVDELAARDLLPDAMVHAVPAVDRAAGEGELGTGADDELAAGLLPVFWLTTAVLGHRPSAGLRLAVGYTETAEGDRPAQAALPGLLRALALEHSRFAAVAVRVPAAGPDVADVLADELLRLPPTGEPEDRVREVRRDGAQRRIRDLVAVEEPAGPAPTGGVWLVTGGAGVLGRLFAGRLARAGATVVLAGRSALDDDDTARLAALGEPGSTVAYERADIADPAQTGALVDRIRNRYGPLTGVVHAAGVTRDKLATGKTPEDLADVLAPKVSGILNLDRATAGEPLEVLLLCSSVAAHTGNLGQADYAYANAFLDAFAADRERRRAVGERSGRTVSVSWPLWADGGMTVEDGTRALFASRWGAGTLSMEDGLVVFDRMLAGGVGCVVVDPGAPSTPATEPVRPAVDQRPAAAEPAVVEPAPAGADPWAVVEADLRRSAAGFLLVDERHVDLDADLMETGFDSISLTELVNQVNERYDLDLLPTVLFECVNLRAFGAYLVEHHGDAVAARAPAEPVPPAAPQPRPEAPAVAEPDPEAEPGPPAVPERAESPAVPEPAAVTEPVAAAGADAEPTPVARSGPAPVAVIGMAAVLPGSPDLATFWRHLAAGDDLIGPPPADRRELRTDPELTEVRGGFLDEVRAFDARLFGISAREAALMDPQQRLFLQAVWRTFEDAGYPPSAFAGTDTGLFVGVSACDYDDLLRHHDVPVEAHTASGVANCVLANRVSYRFDLRGPSEAIDTACSSSLVALHHAVCAIQSGECTAALAGGVNLLLSPGLFVAFTKSGMLSADGRCKSFDSAADGYGRGEGVGAVLLKPLDRALADGDTVHGVIRSTAVNHGGHATSLTAPNPVAQARVIVDAYRRGGIDPATVTYVETHGTGTRLGDPIEVEGLKKAYEDLGAGIGSERVAIGTVKSNIGHLESAAGIAGLLKVLLAGRHGQLPPSINIAEPNPYLRLAGSPFFLNRELRDWAGVPGPDGRPVRRAGISSFGFGGTNAHAIVDAGESGTAAEPGDDLAPPPYALVLSAPSAAALTGYATRLADHLAAAPAALLPRIAYTLQVGREPFAHRLALVAADRDEAVRMLRAAAGGDAVEGVHRSVVRKPARPGAGGPDGGPAGGSDPHRLAAAWVAGEAVDWSAAWPVRPRRLPGLPSFPFDRTHYWFDERSPQSDAEVTTMDVSSTSGSEPTPDDRSRASVESVPPARQPVAEPSAPATAGASAPPAARSDRPKVTLAPARRRPSTAAAASARPADAATPSAEQADAAEPTSGVVEASAAGSGTAALTIIDPSPIRPPKSRPDDHDATTGTDGVPERPSRAGEQTAAAGADAVDPRPDIRERLAAILDTSPEAVEDDLPFAELGLDSIFRMELVRRLNSAFGIELKAEDLYQHDSVAALATFVGGRLGARPGSAAGPAPAPEPQPERESESGPLGDAGSSEALRPAASEPEPDLPRALADLIGEVSGRSVNPEHSFAGNGFTSFDMLRTISELEKRFGPLPKTLLFDAPTLPELADELIRRYGDDAAPRLRNGHRPVASGADLAARLTAEAAPAGPRTRKDTDGGEASVTDGGSVLVLKRALAERPELAKVFADLERRYGKEGGLAGRDIAPMALLGASRDGYFHVSVRDDILFAWSYVGSAGYFPVLAAELVRYARAHKLRPNFLSLLHLTEVAGEPVTATPFGAVQRLENLAGFTLSGGRMSRLRYMVGRFERAGDARTEEYRSGSDRQTDQMVAGMLDSWTRNKQMVNPYVTVVREEIRRGELAERHRLFLTYLDDTLANAIIVTRIPSEPGHLLDLEFYPPKAPLGGLEFAIVRIIEKLVSEGDTMFSFGASFGVSIVESENAAPEVVRGLEELRSAGIFGRGNFQFKNKFRPTNLPIYLCQPAGEDRTPVADVILMIADPDLVGPDTPDNAPAQQAPAPAPAGPAVGSADGFRDRLAAHGYNVLAVPHDQVAVDLATDSWAELDGPAVRSRVADLSGRAATVPDGARPDWLPFAHLFTTSSGRSAEALLCRCWPGRRGLVIHNGLFPTWMVSLAENGFRPVAAARRDDSGDLDLDRLAALLAEPGGDVSFLCVELSDNAAGGRPVSPDNLRGLRALADQHDVALVLDATRMVENAALTGGETELWTAVRETLALAHTATVSLPKDFGVPSGGLLVTDDASLAAAAREHAATHGHDLPLTARKQAAAALADTAGVAGLVRERLAAVRAFHQPLAEAGAPVLAPGTHCVLLDTARLPQVADFEHPVPAFLAWVYAETGVRGAPHLADGADLAGAVRFAIPLGLGVDRAAEVGRRIAALLTSGSKPSDLVAADATASPVTAEYHPVETVPTDVAGALRDAERPADDNQSVLREHCSAVRRHLLSRPGGQVEVFEAGEGPALVLLPPFNIGAGLFARQFAGLSDRFRVFSVHHPGVGATSGVEDLSLDGLAELARSALRELGVRGRVHVAGASFGGLPALSYVLRYPDEVASLILLGSSFKIGNRVGEINRLAVVAGQDFDAVRDGAGELPDRCDLERLLLRCESMDPRTGLRYLDVFAARPSLLDRLPEVAVPTLVLQGRHDTVIPLKTAHLLHGAIPDAEYRELPGAGHFPSLTHADEVNAAITAFTARHAGAGTEAKAARQPEPAGARARGGNR